jgi:hypothetical protein
MSPAIIFAIGIVVAAALGVGLIAARRAGGTVGPERYGHELDEPTGGRGRRRARPGARNRAMVAVVAGALAALGAGIATGLSHGPHKTHGTD